MYARAITSRKNICLTLAVKYQLKFAHFLLNQDTHKDLSISIKHKINSDLEFLSSTLNMPSNSFISYSKVDFKGTVYKIGNYVSSFKQNICLYEILEIIIMKDSVLLFIVGQIQLGSYNTHIRAYEVNKNKNKISKSIIGVEELSGPPININEVSNGRLMIRLKEYC